MSNTAKKPGREAAPPSADEVLRRMLAMPPDPKKSKPKRKNERSKQGI